ncbi:Protein of unknown function [Leuconostoc citreum]|nr:Protein of unknown function [Leuconostoc citreum]CDX65857.1 Protein of unknown function [Leuconostoc citreum]
MKTQVKDAKIKL